MRYFLFNSLSKNNNSDSATCELKYCHSIVENGKNSAWIILFALTLGGCNPADKSNPTIPSDTVVTQETVQVGTDLDIAELNVLGETYTEETGIKIEWQAITDADIKALLQIDDAQNLQPSLNSESKLPEALDMLLMHSSYTLNTLRQMHQLQPVASQTLLTTIPNQYQDPNGEWYGLTKYARTLVYNINKVNEPEILNYASLTADKWMGRLCMTAIEKPENQAILKAMLPYRGQKRTPEVLQGWINNVNNVSQDDEHILTQIEQGACDVGVVNSDVFWRYAKRDPNTQIRLTWANQINNGVMTNAITAGITTSGDDAGRALDFMEWLVSDTGQALLAFHTSTFPIVDITDDIINMKVIRPDWTQFNANSTSLSDIMEDKNEILVPDVTLDD